MKGAPPRIFGAAHLSTALSKLAAVEGLMPPQNLTLSLQSYFVVFIQNNHAATILSIDPYAGGWHGGWPG